MFYRHFRNKKIYRFVAYATLEATQEPAVVYQAMYGEHGIWVRTRANFFEEALPGVLRFAPVTLAQMSVEERVGGMSFLFREALPEGLGAARVLPVLEVLREYMDSGLWMKDYEADERGALDASVDRAVLSQDGLYNLLQGHED